jgi:hypothetical protein
MIDAVLDGVGSDPQRQQGGIHRAQNLDKRDVEITQPGLRFLLAIVLRLAREIILQMPDLMRERAVLRHEQQCRQHYLQQTALHDHSAIPGVVSDRFKLNRLHHNARKMQNRRNDGAILISTRLPAPRAVATLP